MKKEFSAVCLLLMSFLLFSTMAKAAAFTVTRNDDRNNATCAVGDCSLREAIKAANINGSSDTINFAGGITSIQLTSALPDVSSVISIQGGSGVTVMGNKATTIFRPFHVVIAGVGNLTLDKITVTNGKETAGGGLWNQATAALTNCTFSGNEATSDAGGIYNTGTMTISNTVINGNFAIFKGGGIANGGTLTITESTVSFNNSNQPSSTLANSGGGGIHNVGFLTVIRSTISGNTTAGNGGGISNGAQFAVKIINSTISFNSANQGTGGGFYDLGAGTTVTNATIATNSSTLGGGFYNENTNQSSFLRNTIVAANTGGASTSDVFGAFSSSFNNLVGKSDGSTGLVDGADGNIVGTIAVPVNPQLNALGNNGGATQTHSFNSTTSPAINAGSNTLAVDQNNQPLTTDQRGTGFPRINSTAVDIGAFESSAATAAATLVGGRILTSAGRGISKARITLTDATGQTRFVLSNPFGYYRFTDVAVGKIYIVAVSHKSFQFAQSIQILNINEEISNWNFTALSLK